ncbi:hypothetical protein ACFLYQ_03780 [Chloroflexota bacterium]
MDIERTSQQSTEIPEPGVSFSFGNGWKQLWKYPLELFLILLIYFVISAPGSIGSWTGPSVNTYTFWDFFGSVYGLLISGPVAYGMYFAYLKAARGNTPDIKDMFESFNTYWNAVLANLLSSVIIVIGFALLIVPGIIFACKLAFVPFLVVEYKMDAVTAVKESWHMTNGYAMDVFLIGLLAIPIAIAGIICFGVGIFVSMMWITLTTASLYHSVSLKYRASLQKPA